MVNIDTILLAGRSMELRQKLRVILEDEYNLLECKTLDVAQLMLEQNLESLAMVLLDLDELDDDTLAQLRAFCRDENKMGIPVLAVLGQYSPEAECLALEAGAEDVVARDCDSLIIRCRARILAEDRRERSRLHQLVENQNEMLLHANETMIDTLSSLIEYRSAESGLHILRIRRFTKILLEEVARVCPEYGLTERIIAEITSASALHDVGKIAIPDSILNKPARLTPEERKVIETHSGIGAQIVERMNLTVDPQYLKYAYNICKYHHERWDGKGYPMGLVGDDIPICAQVVGLADVYDALTTKRVYKDAYAAEAAAQMIFNGECGLFSPKLLECFKLVRRDFFELSRLYSDDRLVREDKVVDLELPGPVHQQEISSLHKAQNKYAMLLTHLNATVVELDSKLQNYHVVYNPTSALAQLNTGDTFRASIDNLLERYARPEEREEVARSIFEHIENQQVMGLKRQRFEISFGGGIMRRQAYEITLLSMNKMDAQNRLMIMIWQDKQDEYAEASAVSDEAEAERLFGKLTNKCIIRNDHWLTMEDNTTVAALLGYTSEGFKERFDNRLIRVVVEEDRYTLEADIQRHLEEDTEIEMVLNLQHADGQVMHVLFKGLTFMDEQGMEQIVGTMLKLDRAWEKQRSMLQELARMEMIVDQVEHAIFELDLARDEFVYAKNWEKLFGYAPEKVKISELLEKSLNLHPDDLEKIHQVITQGNMGKRHASLDVRVLGANGRYLWHRFSAIFEFDKKQNAKRVVGIIYNVDKEKRSEQQLLQKTEVDALTRLLNKDAARKYVEQCLMDMDGKQMAALLLIDLDNFKGVNDRYGHMFGDAVLCEVALTIRKQFRPDDVVARIGGDEYMVMMRPGVTRDLINRRCDALCKAVKERLDKLVHEGDVSCSVGVAFALEHAANYSDLFQRADKALYLSKKKGKNCFTVYDSNDAAYWQLNVPEGFSTRIESDDNPGLADNGIVRYAFKRLYEAQNEEEAINSILAMIGEQMNVDRVYIFEDSADGQYCNNTFEWCHEGIAPQIDKLQNIHYANDVSGFRESFNEHGIFYCPDVEKLSEPVYSVVKMQGIRSMLCCAIREKGEFCGYVGFDECTEERIWTKEQIDVLTFISEMLSVFLIKMRAQRKTNQYVRNLTSILDSRSEFIYVVDGESYEIKFVNAKARDRFAGIDVGQRCFEAINGMVARCEDCPTRHVQIGEHACNDMGCSKFGWTMHVEASVVTWQGKSAYLIVCKDSQDVDEPEAVQE